jgi:phage protein D
MRLYNKYEYTVSLTFPGDPALITGRTVLLTGWGAFDGKYIIKQAKHSVTGSGYTTQISLRHVLEGY